MFSKEPNYQAFTFDPVNDSLSDMITRVVQRINFVLELFK